MGLIKTHKELDVYKLAFESAMDILDISKSFPKEETYFHPVKSSYLINYRYVAKFAL